MSTGKTVAITLALALMATAAAGLGFIYTGVYNVAADRDHTGLMNWVLETTAERSIGARAAEVGDPPAPDSSSLAHGFDHYQAMCVKCHGAPGVERGESGQGMAPTPPDLAESARTMTPQELFWVTKHGIKFAGMPAFGPTHSDEEIWGLVAFMEQLPEMSADAYQLRVERQESGDGGHSHAEGTPAHDH